MFDFYRNVLNGLALQQIHNRASIPDVSLGVGYGEDTTPQPLQIALRPIQSVKATLNDLDEKYVGRGKQFDEEEATKPAEGLAWLGASIETY